MYEKISLFKETSRMIKRFKSVLLFILLPTNLLFSQANEWEKTGELCLPVANAQAVVYKEKIYILGGYSGESNEAVYAIQEFDPVSGSCTIVGKMQTPRSGFIADIFNDSILICGGVSENTLKASSIEIWQPTNAAAIFATDSSLNRINPTGGIYKQSSLFVIGGYADPSFGIISPLSYIVELNLESKKATFVSEPSDEPLPYQQSSAFYDEGVYIFGGVYNGVSNKVHKFDISSHKNERIYPNLIRARAGAVAVKTEDGRIYLIGGYNERAAAIDSIEIYQVGEDTNSTRLAQPLLEPRKELTAARIRVNDEDDRIYVFGGIDENDHIVSSIEMLQLSAELTAVAAKETSVKDFALENNFPNPFNSSTKIRFNIQNPSHVRLDIFTTLGQLLRTITNEPLMAGHYEYLWDGKDNNGQPVPSNVYIYRLLTDSYSVSKKMILLK